ncbi:Crp/Fnr family transcriptional regulator [Pleurocapsales cyanobacterium LEGE 06147]|nr:Crp/Fnr family transcriptional regulator [Pleurocapsales cyanobacterium LEGE 06147]
MEKYIQQMKQDYDSLFPVSEELYRLISLYLEFKKKKKGDILKRSGSVETCSRYIIEGYVGIYYLQDEELQLRYVLRPTDTVFDMLSYVSEEKSCIEIRALTEVLFFEFHKDAEIEVVKRYPEFAQLGILINHRIQQRLAQQNAILGMDFKEGYPEFVQLFPRIELFLKNWQWASLFQCSPRTISRFLNKRKGAK